MLVHDEAIATATVRSPLGPVTDDEAALLVEALAAGRRRIAALL